MPGTITECRRSGFFQTISLSLFRSPPGAATLSDRCGPTFPLLEFPRQVAPTLVGQEGRAFVELLRCRVAERQGWLNDGRVGRKQNLTRAAAGWGLQGVLEGRGELGQGGDSAFRPREARERQQIRASGKAFVRSTKSSCALHGFASDVCWRVSRGIPPALPRSNPPHTISLRSIVRGPRVWFSAL